MVPIGDEPRLADYELAFNEIMVDDDISVFNIEMADVYHPNTVVGINIRVEYQPGDPDGNLLKNFSFPYVSETSSLENVLDNFVSAVKDPFAGQYIKMRMSIRSHIMEAIIDGVEQMSAGLGNDIVVVLDDCKLSLSVGQ